ncbi:MAG: ATP-dependent sacrificial sulfur transferase LarE [Nitrospinae bacterium]|nr:ATP-dependent sacrificial sulfur transferase LarE [Nitrospinota bacterium]
MSSVIAEAQSALNNKLEKLEAEIRKLGSVLVAFSGGVDSSFLLKTAHDTLSKTGGRALGVTARSSTYPAREFEEAVKIAGLIGAEHMVIVSEELEIDGFAENPVNRCYFCKGELFGKLSEIAGKEGIAAVLDGANVDDLTDHRPGAKAARENGVRSLLIETGFTKDDIRALSKEMGLPTWDKPSFACLASRFPYGTQITNEKLTMVDRAEEFLRKLGFAQLRVRHHGEVARIELDAAQMAKAIEPAASRLIYGKLKEIGFKYVALDIAGYRTGSMNEGMKAEKTR